MFEEATLKVRPPKFKGGTQWRPRRVPQELPLRTRLYEKQEGFCYYCGKVTMFENFTLDHVIPRSRGGRGQHNYVGACAECNRDKGHLTAEEFLELRANQKARKARLTALNEELQRQSRQRRRAWAEQQERDAKKYASFPPSDWKGIGT